MLGYIIGTMLAAGIVGGLINSYLSDPTSEKPLTWWQHLIVGIGAAFMVPVFLNMISSHLISEISGNAITPEVLSKLLVLAGFCLLAAVSSRAFIRSMTDRLLQEISTAKKVAQEANDTAKNAEEIANLTVEPEVQSTSPTQKGTSLAEAPGVEVNDTEKQILKAMVESRFSMRSISGIAKDSGVTPETVNTSIGNMLNKELINEGKNKDGQLRWYPTPLGRQLAHDA